VAASVGTFDAKLACRYRGWIASFSQPVSLETGRGEIVSALMGLKGWCVGRVVRYVVSTMFVWEGS